MLTQEQTRLIGPARVLEDGGDRCYAAGPIHELSIGVEEEAPLLLGRELDRRRNVRKGAAGVGHELRHFGCRVPKHVPQRACRDDARSELEYLDERDVRRRTFSFVAMPNPLGTTPP